MVDPIKIVQALVGAELTAEKGGRYAPRGNVITVSRMYGCGGDDVAQQLADRLDLHYYDKQILEAIVAAAPENKALMERLDQQVTTMREEVMHMIVTGKSPTEEYRHYLLNVILGIARHSGVIVGRGAHLLLADYRAFRVRIVASEETCAARVAERQHISQQEALRWARQADQEHSDYIRKVFGRDVNDPITFDLVINTDHIGLEQAVNVILFAMQQTGYHIPPKALKADMGA
jgi:cytidylate kinase